MMIVLTYLDAYQTKKKASFNSIEEFMLSLSGCVTFTRFLSSFVLNL